MATGYRVVTSFPLVVTTSPFYSGVFSLLRGDSFSLQYVYTGGVGAGILQYSNNGNDWVDVTGTSQALSGSSSNFYDILTSGAAAVRLKFTGSIGSSGTLYVCSRG